MQCFRHHVESPPQTSQQLWDWSRNLAYHLRKNCGVETGDRVVIVYPFGIDFRVGLIALLRMGVVAVSYTLPTPPG
jgi:acyl-CoA synthetase (AMP-forming)/AMP-acid ligase II